MLPTANREEHYQGINLVTLSGYTLQTERNITSGLTMFPSANREEHYQGINRVTLSGYTLQTERNNTR
jgi:hypothetical protein